MVERVSTKCKHLESMPLLDAEPAKCLASRVKARRHGAKTESIQTNIRLSFTESLQQRLDCGFTKSTSNRSFTPIILKSSCLTPQLRSNERAKGFDPGKKKFSLLQQLLLNIPSQSRLNSSHFVWGLAGRSAARRRVSVESKGRTHETSQANATSPSKTFAAQNPL